jgi:glutamate racemase
MRREGLSSKRRDDSLRRLPLVASPSIVPALRNLAPRAARHPILSGPVVTPRALASPIILVLDSGLGGLTVYREIARMRPDARFVYAADDAVFPVGAMTEQALTARVLAVMERLLTAHQPDLVVIACNTISTLVLPALRARFTVPFVGTVPAIKPACAASRSKLVSVLGTKGTVQREYTHALIREFAADCEVTLVGSAHLASLAERKLRGETIDDAAIAAEIAPCFVTNGTRRTDTVVLACTHYPLLLDQLTRLAAWPVTFLDPAPAIARRVVDLVGPAQGDAAPVPAQAIFTSGRLSPALATTLQGFGIAGVAGFDTPPLSA